MNGGLPTDSNAYDDYYDCRAVVNRKKNVESTSFFIFNSFTILVHVFSFNFCLKKYINIAIFQIFTFTINICYCYNHIIL